MGNGVMNSLAQRSNTPSLQYYGIELLNADQQLRGDNGGHFVIVNEAAGKTEDIALET
jgi:hypothetical protein